VKCPGAITVGKNKRIAKGKKRGRGDRKKKRGKGKKP
jgi:hypothetical protein